MSADQTRDLSNLSMLELFRMEIESQNLVLTQGLLALEREPQSAQYLEALMRAAHSLKGAARIVNRAPAVRVAHAMEDCFVGAQKSMLVLSRERTDLLLQGVDLLNSIAAISDEEIGSWEEENKASIDSFVAALATWKSQPGQGELAARAGSTSQNSAPQDRQAPAETGAGPAGPSRALRVSSENLNLLLGLAGELRIASSWPGRFAGEVLNQRRLQSRLSQSLDALRQSLAALPLSERAQTQFLAVRDLVADCQKDLAERQKDLDDFDRQFTNLSTRLYSGVLESRMRPFSEGISAFPRMVRDLARELGKGVRLEVTGESTPVDRDILEKLEAPLTHLLRNALDHGIEPTEERRARGKPLEGTIRLDARHNSGMLLVTVSDDGKGLGQETIRRRIVEKNLTSAEVAASMNESELYDFLFLPGFTMKDHVTELSGRGVGLDVVQATVKEVGGRVRAGSEPGGGAHFVLELPLTLSVIRALVFEVAREPYAIPLARIASVIAVPKNEVESLEGRQHFRFGGEQIGLVSAQQVLDSQGAPIAGEVLPVIVLGDKMHRYGLVVDRFLFESELVVLALDPRLGKVKDVSAAAILLNRTPVLIVDVDDMIRSIENLASGGGLANLRHRAADSEIKKKRRVLVVDDSLTIRELQRKLLTNRGYEVEVAVDGMEGWNAVREGHYDLLITDIDMPRLDGIELVTLVKKDARLGSLPVMIVSYKDREEDRRRGLEAGADYYLTKASFHDETLLQAVADLIGGPEE